MTPAELHALNEQRYQDAKRWYARYRYSPRRLLNIVRQWLRRLPGQHCLVDNGQGPNWFGLRCTECGRRITVTFSDGLFRHSIERGCPLTDDWAAATAAEAAVVEAVQSAMSR